MSNNIFTKFIPALIFQAVFFICPFSSYGLDSTSINSAEVKVQVQTAGGVPIGTIIAWPVATDPPDSYKWLECDGNPIPEQFAELIELVGPNTPNYQGMFLRGQGSQTYNSGGYGNVNHASGGIGKIQGDTIRNVYGTISTNDINSDIQAFGETDRDFTSVTGAYIPYWSRTRTTPPHDKVVWNLTGFTFDASIVSPTATEIRPVNKAVRYLIRALR